MDECRLKIYIAQTQEIAKKRAPEGFEPIGVRGQIYSTPDEVILDDTLMIDARTWDWLLRSHVLSARKGSCGNTSLWAR